MLGLDFGHQVEPLYISLQWSLAREQTPRRPVSREVRRPLRARVGQSLIRCGEALERLAQLPRAAEEPTRA